MRPRTVLHVLGGAGGGAAMSTIALIRALDDRGIRSAAVVHEGGTPREHAELVDAVGGRVVRTTLAFHHRRLRTPMLHRPALWLRQGLVTGWGRRSAAAVTDAARSFGADLVHTATVVNREGARAAAALDLPHVWHVRELVGDGEAYRFWSGSLGRGLRSAHVVIANSSVTARLVVAHAGETPVLTIPNAIDERLLRLPPRPEPSDIVIGMVASLESTWKGHGDFVRVAELLADDQRVRFRVFGRDPDSAYSRRIHDLVRQAGLEARLSFEGHTDPLDAFSQIDVLLHPAVSESFGRVVIEAMAAGRPVVGPDSGGVGALVEHGVTGLLAPPRDVAAMARHVRSLIDDARTRRAMGRRGRELASSMTINRHVDQVIEAYELAFERAGGRHACE